MLPGNCLTCFRAGSQGNINEHSSRRGKVNKLSGKVEFIGNTPVRHSFDFHSDISVLKTKISACGYYDTTIKVTPQIDSLKIAMERKKFIILPYSQADTLYESEHKYLSLLLKAFLESFSAKNISQPVNYMDFAVFKKTGKKSIITLIFEIDPEDLVLPRTVSSDSLMVAKWNELFSGTTEVFNKKQFANVKNTDFYFSVISGKKNLSVRHLPGVEQNNEFRVETKTYEGDYQRVTVTTSYYETVINPTFNTSLNQSQKYSELLFRLTTDDRSRNYLLDGIGALSFTNGKMNLIYESYPGLSEFSMLTRFMNVKR